MDNWGKSAPIRNWYPHPIGASFDSRDRQEAILSLVEIQGEKARESQWRQKKRCHRGNGTSSERNEARRTTIVAPESSRSSLRNSGLASESQEATALLSCPKEPTALLAFGVPIIAEVYQQPLTGVMRASGVN